MAAAKRLKNELKIDMKFNDDFNANLPRRRNSVDLFQPVYNDSAPIRERRSSVGSFQSTYDSRGRIRETKRNVCDCLDNHCAGCHFPCKNCRSPKCGPDCRQNRYDYTARIRIDGKKPNDAIRNSNF